MVEFLRRNRVLVSTLVLLALGAALVVGTVGQRLREDRLGQLFLELMSPLQQATTAVSQVLEDGWDSVFGVLRARGEAGRLRERVGELERRTSRLAEAELENARLRALLDFRETLAGDLLAARVIARDATALSRTLTIDRGTSDGVDNGAAVLAPEGIVGHVFLASANAARVLLITDHNSGVDAVVQRTRARGIVEGTVDGRCGLKFVKRTEDLLVGDPVLTSGLDGMFPRSTPIGRIVMVDKRGQGLFQYATVEPAVDFDRLEEVLVARGQVERMVEPPAPPADEEVPEEAVSEEAVPFGPEPPPGEPAPVPYGPEPPPSGAPAPRGDGRRPGEGAAAPPTAPAAAR